MKGTKEITPAKYAKWRGCSTQYVHKALKEGELGRLPEVVRVKKYSRFYVLVVPDGLGENSFVDMKPKKRG